MNKNPTLLPIYDENQTTKIRIWPIVFVVGFYAESDLVKEDQLIFLEDFLMACDVSLLNVDFETYPKDLSSQIFEALKLGVSKHTDEISHVAEYLKQYFENLKGLNFWPEVWSDSLKKILIPSKNEASAYTDLEYVYARAVVVKDIRSKDHVEKIINFSWGTSVRSFVFRLYENKKELENLPIPHYRIPAFSIHDVDAKKVENAATEIQKVLFNNMAALKEYIKEVDHDQYNN